MDSLEDTFNEKFFDPAVRYLGYEGYERGIYEILASFYDAFPQCEARIDERMLKILVEQEEYDNTIFYDKMKL